MKKFLAMLLMAAVLFTGLAPLVGCGGDEKKPTPPAGKDKDKDKDKAKDKA